MNNLREKNDIIKKITFYVPQDSVTAIRNASMCGVIETVCKYEDNVYAGRNGCFG